MRLAAAAILLAAALVLAAAPSAQTTPPYAGTIFLDPDIVLPSDPSVFEAATYTGRGLRTVFDRRVNAFVEINAYLFGLSFSDGTTIEAQINPEFGSEARARTEAETYGRFVGQLARALRRDVDALWIHMGVEPFGGGNRSILIHTGQAALYVRDGVLEETLIHEAAHTSLDADHATSPGWIAAQGADPTFISTYARDNPQREDIAESVLPYLAVRYRRNRISADVYDTVTAAIPNRIAYFDAQGFDLTPFHPPPVAVAEEPAEIGLAVSVAPNPVATSATFRLVLDRSQRVHVDVLNVLGERVAEVASGVLPAGETAFRWAVREDLATGTYFVRILAEGTSRTRAVTITR